MINLHECMRQELGHTGTTILLPKKLLKIDIRMIMV